LFYIQTKGKLLDFYKERVQQFYDGHVEEVNFNTIGDLVRRRTNLLMKRQTHRRVPEYLRGNSILLRPPLAVFSANIFQVRTLVKKRRYRISDLCISYKLITECTHNSLLLTMHEYHLRLYFIVFFFFMQQPNFSHYLL